YSGCKVGIVPGWHSTIFPPFFVVGAIFSGFAMVMTLMVIIRKIYKLTDYITDNHMDAIARILIFISLIMATSYITELFIAWYSGNEYEMFAMFRNRVTGDYTAQFWGMIVFNAIIPQLFWFRKIRRNWVALLLISLIINIGMWLERYNIVVTSLSKDFLPSNWVSYTPTFIDIGVFVGTIGLFALGVLLFMRYIPMMAISEIKGVVHIGNKKED
ncbi:MAG: hydrogenase, partial [Bacteroidetes bacterium]